MVNLWKWVLGGSRAPAGGGDNSSAPAGVPHKWLPCIDTDSCIGCEQCVNVCEHACLEMIWSFATLTRAQDCGSEGLCAEACPESVIHMAWVPLEADGCVGQWRGASAGGAEG